MTLFEIIRDINKFDEAGTIYVKEPWTCDSTAIVAIEPDSGGLPKEAESLGLDYFIEVVIARDFLSDWVAALCIAPSTREQCERLIKYAINDA
jgi:hypothetical protein